MAINCHFYVGLNLPPTGIPTRHHRQGAACGHGCLIHKHWTGPSFYGHEDNEIRANHGINAVLNQILKLKRQETWSLAANGFPLQPTVRHHNFGQHPLTIKSGNRTSRWRVSTEAVWLHPRSCRSRGGWFMKHLWLERSMNWFKGKGERRKMCLYLQISPNDQIDWDFRQVFPPFLGQPSLIFAPTALSLCCARRLKQNTALVETGMPPTSPSPNTKKGSLKNCLSTSDVGLGTVGPYWEYLR